MKSEDHIHNIRECIVKLSDLESKIKEDDDIIKNAVDVAHGAAFVAGVLDVKLDLSDPKDKMIATAKFMLEELARNFWVECSENGIDVESIDNPNLNLSPMWMNIESRLAVDNGKVVLMAEKKNNELA